MKIYTEEHKMKKTDQKKKKKKVLQAKPVL